MAPRAATAASRHRASGWPRPTSDSAATASAGTPPISPEGEAGRPRPRWGRGRRGRRRRCRSPPGPKVGGQLGGPDPDLRRRDLSEPATQVPTSSRPSRARAPRAVARTEGAGSVQAAPRAPGSSPPMAGQGGLASARHARRLARAGVAGWRRGGVSCRPHGGRPSPPPTRSRSATAATPSPMVTAITARATAARRRANIPVRGMIRTMDGALDQHRPSSRGSAG